MSDNISSLLNSLYHTDATVASLEKTAEDALISALRDEGQVDENPLSRLSTEDLIKIAQQMGEEPEQAEAPIPELFEKTAQEMLGGQVMAHAMVHEMGLIKQAMSNGLCRICKEASMDIEGASICSSCLDDGE